MSEGKKVGAVTRVVGFGKALIPIALGCMAGIYLVRLVDTKVVPMLKKKEVASTPPTE